MNYLSHYYFDKDDDRPHYILGLILPDLVRTFNRERLHKQIVEEYWEAPIQALQQGVNKHHHIDQLFHSSQFFKTYNKKAFKELQQIELEGITKYKHFVSHVLIEMLLDRLLLKEDLNTGFTFYSKLNATKKFIFTDYFNHIPAIEGDLERLWSFFQRFCDMKFLFDYQHNEGMILRLNGVMQRITKQAFTVKDCEKLSVFIDGLEDELKEVYKGVFEDLGR
ncbi:MAG: ACP phosphodiesterase [Chitinophagales bacterium]